MATIFTKIIKGELNCHQILEDEDFFAFLDIHPIVKGHTLVVPKQEIDYLFDLDDRTLAGLQIFSKKIAIALKEAFSCERVSVIVAGFEVPHAHVHLIPSNSMEDLDFSHKLKFSEEEFVEIAQQIRSKLA